MAGSSRQHDGLFNCLIKAIRSRPMHIARRHMNTVHLLNDGGWMMAGAEQQQTTPWVPRCLCLCPA